MYILLSIKSELSRQIIHHVLHETYAASRIINIISTAIEVTKLCDIFDYIVLQLKPYFLAIER